MTVEELEDMIADLRDEVVELRNKVRLLEDENTRMLYEMQNIVRYQCEEFNEAYNEIYDIKRDLAKHCRGFHSTLITGGGKK